jgi:hypothetical protein
LLTAGTQADKALFESSRAAVGGKAGVKHCLGIAVSFTLNIIMVFRVYDNKSKYSTFKTFNLGKLEYRNNQALQLEKKMLI